jgi:predicted ester cyclase
MSTASGGKELVRRWFLEGMNSGSLNAAVSLSNQIFAADFIDHDGLEVATLDRQAWQESVLQTVFKAFTDITVRVEQLLAEDDRVAVRYVFHGTHIGPFMRIPATHRRIRHSENEIYRITECRIVESWGEGDWLGTLRQLGALPA